jgi:hypothetical protein
MALSVRWLHNVEWYGEWWIGEDLEGSHFGLIEMLSLEGKPQAGCPVSSRDSNRTSPEHDPKALPLDQPARFVGFKVRIFFFTKAVSNLAVKLVVGGLRVSCKFSWPALYRVIWHTTASLTTLVDAAATGGVHIQHKALNYRSHRMSWPGSESRRGQQWHWHIALFVSCHMS